MIARLRIATRSRVELQEITSQVRQAVAQRWVVEGVCHLFVPHTTAGLVINEHADPDVIRDIEAQLETLAPASGRYRHAEGNAPGHIKSTIVGCSLALFIENGQLVLGTWQGIFFAEFDGPRERTVLVKVVQGQVIGARQALPRWEAPVRTRLYRSETDRMIAGVAGGLAEYFDIDPIWARLIFVLLTVASGVGILIYIVLWIIMPPESRVGAHPSSAARENVEEMGQRARELGKEMRATFRGGQATTEQQEQPEQAVGTEAYYRDRPPRRRGGAGFVIGIILVILGVIFLLNNFSLLWWLNIGMLWPLILIAIGLAIFFSRRER